MAALGLSPKCVCLFAHVLLLFFVGALATARNEGKSGLLRISEAEKRVEGLSNSTLTASYEDEGAVEALNEHAVDNPDEVAAMVEM